MKKTVITLLMVLTAAVTMAGCKKEEPKEKPKVVEEEPEPPKAVEEPVKVEPPKDTTPKGKARSLLSGEWIDKKIAQQRPYAMMIGNTSDALPQYGISKADVIYEVPVEGSYTRLMAIFQDTTGLEKIGSGRSCRHYFIYFALEFDAIYVHYGQAVYAEPILAQDNVNNINGMGTSAMSEAFVRDANRPAPHNVFTSDASLKQATKKLEYREKYKKNYKGHYKFAADNEEVKLAEGKAANVVSPGYFVSKPWFVYNKKEGLYYRYEFKDKQIDAGANDQQLAVKNILLQYCDWAYKDDNGYLDVNTIPANGTGTGKYFTNGKMIDITWTKADENSPAQYFDSNGQELTINQGKTWVCVVRDTYADRFGVYKNEEELQAARASESD
jgi:hypothetical protein